MTHGLAGHNADLGTFERTGQRRPGRIVLCPLASDNVSRRLGLCRRASAWKWLKNYAVVDQIFGAIFPCMRIGDAACLDVSGT